MSKRCDGWQILQYSPALPVSETIDVQKLVLASSSRYRRGLLERLGVDFDVAAPDIEERAREGEGPRSLSARLAREKAAKIARNRPHAVVIGSDQVAALGERVLGKPGTVENARRQLLACSGESVRFFTAVCVLNGATERQHVDETVVTFRNLEAAEIDAYIAREQPLDCAGSFRAEGLGIILFQSVKSEDPTALVGLPLIWLSQALRELDLPLL